MKVLTDFLILHLADSALPTGGFAYSSGMEAMMEFGLLKNENELFGYITDFCRQVISFDFPYLNSIYHADFSDNHDNLLNIVESYDATFNSSAMYNGSLNQGRNWVRLMKDIFDETEKVEELQAIFKKKQLPVHYLLVCALSFRILKIDFQTLKVFYLNNTIRDQVSACIRLGSIGPMQGHRMQFQLYQKLLDFMNMETEKDFSVAVKSSFIPDVGQMLQKNVYSKLFKN